MKRWLRDTWIRFKADVVKAHKSFVIWFNGIMGVIVIGLPVLQASFSQLHDHLPDQLFHTLMAIIILGNIVLRFKTSTPLSAK